MIPDSFKQDLLNRVDIVDVVSRYVQLKKGGANYAGLCPFHNDTRPSFDVDPRRQRYRCWSCKKYGDVISFVQEHDKVSFPEALGTVMTERVLDLFSILILFVYFGVVRWHELRGGRPTGGYHDETKVVWHP